MNFQGLFYGKAVSITSEVVNRHPVRLVSYFILRENPQIESAMLAAHKR